MDLRWLKRFVSYLNIKKQIWTILNIICIIVLMFNAIDMAFDYLRYNYSYKLIVDDNNNKGFDLPMIGLCTENKVIFSKTKVIKHFEIENLWQKHYESIINVYKKGGKRICRGSIFQYSTLTGIIDSVQWKINYCLNKFFIYYNKLLFDEMSFDEMNSMTFNGNELFECSAKIHKISNTLL